MKIKSVTAIVRLSGRARHLLTVIVLSILPAVSAFGQPAVAVDLSMRRAVYFTANETQKIDRTGKYVAENGTLILNQSQATSCEEGGCFFNLGVIIFRSPAAGDLVTYATLTTQASYIAGGEIPFIDKEATKEKILSVKLALGANKLVFKVDPYGKISESNEANNSFAVSITVKPKAVLNNPSAGQLKRQLAHALWRPEATPDALTAADLQLTCPAAVVVGIFNAPAGWYDSSKRTVYFTNLAVHNTSTGAQITCDYGGSTSLDRQVPGRVCQRQHPEGSAVVCRVVPSKK